ncbi:MAG TPA: hypothetical protein DD435_06545 [Cyanobacteria bacterium UBA8530]|nr:hypothetical protein [Cyanobacteria bacterium UBA8530]
MGFGLMMIGGCGVQIYEYPVGGDDAWVNPFVQKEASRPVGQPAATITPAPSFNRNPIITSFIANPLNAVNPGDSITLQVDVIDEDHDNLKYTWTATGGTLSTTAGRLVSWIPPGRAGVYSILMSVSDGKGGSAEAAQNVIVRSNGIPAVSGQAAIVNNEDATSSLR